MHPDPSDAVSPVVLPGIRYLARLDLRLPVVGVALLRRGHDRGIHNLPANILYNMKDEGATDLSGSHRSRMNTVAEEANAAASGDDLPSRHPLAHAQNASVRL